MQFSKFVWYDWDKQASEDLKWDWVSYRLRKKNKVKFLDIKMFVVLLN